MKLRNYYPYFEDFHEDIKSLAKNVSQELEKRAREADEKGSEEIMRENLKMLAEHGFLGINVPEQYGGQGLDERSVVLSLEEIARGCAATAFSLGGHYLAVGSILIGGDEALKQRFLPRLIKDSIGAFALTEPNAGSDAASIVTRAEKKNGYYVLRGEKHFITNGSIADIFIVFAKTSPEKGARGITAFVVERGIPGLLIGKKEEKLGVRASPTNQVFLDDVEVPAENIIGKVDEGFKIAMQALTRGRIGMAAQAIGISRLALQLAINYAENRVQFGQPIINQQAIQFMLSDMLAMLRASEELTYKAAWLADRKADVTLEAAVAKLYATEAAKLIVDKSLQIHGGIGYTRDQVIERLYRDVRILTIAEGTSEIQRLVIFRNIKRALD
ncbi:MAG: acyl-CoA dehydrogenase family protein [Fervidicoccaceae archaeon]